MNNWSRGFERVMAIPDYVIACLKTVDASAEPVEMYLVSARIFESMQERGASQVEIDLVSRAISSR